MTNLWLQVVRPPHINNIQQRVLRYNTHALYNNLNQEIAFHLQGRRHQCGSEEANHHGL